MVKSETLRILYEDIKGYTAEAALIYDKIEHVKRTGQLPQLKTPLASGAMDLYQVKDRIKKLNDLICKTQRKLEPNAKPAKPEKIADWQLKVDMAKMEREELYQQKKQLEDE